MNAVEETLDETTNGPDADRGVSPASSAGSCPEEDVLLDGHKESPAAISGGSSSSRAKRKEDKGIGGYPGLIPPIA